MGYWQPRLKGRKIMGIFFGVMLLAGGGINLYAVWVIERSQAGVALPEIVANLRPIGIVMLGGGALLLTGCILSLVRSDRAKALADLDREFPPTQPGVSSPVRYPPPWANQQPPPGHPQQPPGYPQQPPGYPPPAGYPPPPPWYPPPQ